MTKRKGKLLNEDLSNLMILTSRVNAVQNLHTISIALGKERTRNELLPYIMDLMDDEEEILLVLAEQLNGNFLDYVGGHLYAPHLFKPLERLCEIEETTVREKVSINQFSFKFNFSICDTRL